MKVRGKTRKYPVARQLGRGETGQHQWLRENPHRFNLGRIGLHLARADGKAVRSRISPRLVSHSTCGPAG